MLLYYHIYIYILTWLIDQIDRFSNTNRLMSSTNRTLIDQTLKGVWSISVRFVWLDVFDRQVIDTWSIMITSELNRLIWLGYGVYTSLAMHKTYFLAQNCRFASFDMDFEFFSYNLFLYQNPFVLSTYPEITSIYCQLSPVVLRKYHRITHVKDCQNIYIFFEILQEKHWVQHLWFIRQVYRM